MSEEKAYFPMFVDLSGQTILCFGGGHIAARRIRTLVSFAGRIIIFSPHICEELMELVNANPEQVFVTRRAFHPEDPEEEDLINRSFFVLAATDDPEVNSEICRSCRRQNIPVNDCSAQDRCDFFFPGIAEKGNLIAGITASGRDHSLARRATERIRKLFEAEDF